MPTPNPDKYAPEAFNAQGALREASRPTDTLLATLGQYGMVHPLLDGGTPGLAPIAAVSDLDSRAALARSAKDERIGKIFGELGATPEGQALVEVYTRAHEASSQLFGLVGEPVPALEDAQLLEELRRVKPLFESLESLGHKPEITIYPHHKPLEWWQHVAQSLQDSPVNPDGLVKNGGLWVADEVKNAWVALTKPKNESPSWVVQVSSGSEAPAVVNVTSYGYTDQDNKTPSPELNHLLSSMNQPAVPDRNEPQKNGRFGRQTPNFTPPALTQPDIHPEIEGYLTHQFTRIIQKEAPLDPNSWSWLKGELLSGNLPAGFWDPGLGRVLLDYDVAGGRLGALGVRPSGRG